MFREERTSVAGFEFVDAVLNLLRAAQKLLHVGLEELLELTLVCSVVIFEILFRGAVDDIAVDTVVALDKHHFLAGLGTCDLTHHLRIVDTGTGTETELGEIAGLNPLSD